MQSFYDYKKFAVLYVDDEELSLKQFIRAFADDFRVLTAANAQDGYRLIQEYQDSIGVLMTDQRMPGEKGVQLLDKARQLRPRMIRMLVTAYSDVDAAVAAVNTGAIYKYISKPWQVPELQTTLRRALEFFIVQRERDHLLQEKMSVLHNLMVTDRVISWGILAAGLGAYLRRPQAAVRAFLELVPGKLPQENLGWEELRNPNYWRELYAHVQGQLQQVTRLLADLGVPNQPAPVVFADSVSLHAAVGQALGKLAGPLAEKQLRVVNEIPAALPALTVDAPQFHRLCQLLLEAVTQNLPNGGQLLLRAHSSTTGASTPAAITWQIQADGPGLAEPALRSLFDPVFVSEPHHREAAIRLLACHFIAYHHGATLAINPGDGQGMTVHLTLPLAPPAEEATRPQAEALSRVLLNETLWERLLSQE
ncbi:MAG: response regulator [Verrucomicrobia bacterium]|nr:response regulator [Verrucomicrobiota bacterium]